MGGGAARDATEARERAEAALSAAMEVKEESEAALLAATQAREESEVRLRAALQAVEGATEAPTSDPRVAALRARAHELQSQLAQAEERENTLAKYAGYDEDDVGDATLADLLGGPDSKDLEDDLGLLYLSDPAAFHGTAFAWMADHEAEMRADLLGGPRDQQQQAGDGADELDTRDPAEVRAGLERDNAELARFGLPPKTAPEGASLDELDDARCAAHLDIQDAQDQRDAARSEAWIVQQATVMTREQAGNALARAQEVAEHERCGINVDGCPVCSEMADDAYDARRESIDAARLAADRHGWDTTALRAEAVDRGHPGDRTRMRDERAERHALANAANDPAAREEREHEQRERDHEPEL